MERSSNGGSRKWLHLTPRLVSRGLGRRAYGLGGIPGPWQTGETPSYALSTPSPQVKGTGLQGTLPLEFLSLLLFLSCHS